LERFLRDKHVITFDTETKQNDTIHFLRFNDICEIKVYYTRGSSKTQHSISYIDNDLAGDLADKILAIKFTEQEYITRKPSQPIDPLVGINKKRDDIFRHIF